MRSFLIPMIALLALPTFAHASGEPSSLDCYFGSGNEVSFGLDSSDNGTDDLLDGAVFYTSAKPTGGNKKKDSASVYLGQVSGPGADKMGTRTDTSKITDTTKDDTLSAAGITASFKDASGNKIVVTATHGKWVAKQDSVYQISYPAKIFVKLGKLDTSGVPAGADSSTFPQGSHSGTCLYNPGN